MNRTIELLRLFKSCGQIDGRKKLQKIVHILKEAGHPFDFRYGFHFHGPFSAELKSEIDTLTAEQLIDEKDGATSSGEFRQYSYSASEHVEGLLVQLGDSSLPVWDSLARDLNARPAQELEAISTVIYLMRHTSPEARVDEQFKRIKPQLVHHFGVAREFAEKVICVASS